STARPRMDLRHPHGFDQGGGPGEVRVRRHSLHADRGLSASMRAPTLLRFWSHHLSLSHAEVAQFWRMSAGLVLLGAAYSTGTVAAESMILGKGGAASLPGAFEFQQFAVL